MADYKLATIATAIGLAVVLAVFLLTPGINLLHINSNLGVKFTTGSIHTTVTVMKGDKVIQSNYHAGAITQMGMNFTLANIVKNATFYNSTYWNPLLNLTYVSIGDAYATWACNNTQTVLPHEWNRTAGTQHDMTYNTFNITAVFYPDTGPYTYDCIGLNFEDGIGNNAQWGYDTDAEVTGVDDTFTIVVEIKVTVS